MKDLNPQVSRPPDPGWQDSASALLDWYDVSRRMLPWRAPPGKKADAYAVWLSEIMLQQTTVAAVKPYFINFLERWPSVKHLAQAPVEDVMRQWAGLGYYSRARNLHACAKIIEDQHDGNFPPDEADLLKLPGVGPYTAAAITAIAFGRRAVVIDGNVERVVARLFAISTPLPAAKAIIRQKAGLLTPAARPGDYAQGMMDLGATICTPKRPACAICPLSGACAARALNRAEDFPKKAIKPERPLRRGAAFYICRQDGAVLVRNRPPKGLLGGMAEFPGTDWTADYAVKNALAEAPVKGSCKLLEGKIEHVFTHFALELDVYLCICPDTTIPPKGSRFVPRKYLESEGFPSLMRKVMKLAEGVLSVMQAKDTSQGLFDFQPDDNAHVEAPPR
jgi:A/G-specific adenine glycosylase